MEENIMSENKNQIFSSKETLAAVIERAKITQERYKKSIAYSFEDSLLGCYKYSESWYRYNNGDTKRYYTFEEYKERFYSFIIGNLPFLPRVIRVYATFYYEDSHYSKEIDSIVVEELKKYSEKQLDEKRLLKRLESESAELRRMLGFQNTALALKKVLPLYELEKVGKFNGRNDMLMFSIYMFNYGYILGKRKERTKKHS